MHHGVFRRRGHGMSMFWKHCALVNMFQQKVKLLIFDAECETFRLTLGLFYAVFVQWRKMRSLQFIAIVLDGYGASVR